MHVTSDTCVKHSINFDFTLFHNTVLVKTILRLKITRHFVPASSLRVLLSFRCRSSLNATYDKHVSSSRNELQYYISLWASSYGTHKRSSLYLLQERLLRFMCRNWHVSVQRISSLARVLFTSKVTTFIKVSKKIGFSLQFKTTLLLNKVARSFTITSIQTR